MLLRSAVLPRGNSREAITADMIVRVALLCLLAGSALVEAFNMPVVCPCTYVANRVIKVAKNVLIKDDECGCSLPPLQARETYESYIQRVFSQQDKEPVENYYARIFKKYKDESDEKYIERVDKIFTLFPKLPCKDNTQFWKFNEKYYTLKFGKLDSIIPFLKESNDQYLARILRREKDEDFNSFINRLDCVFKAYPKLDIWRRIKFDSDCRNWYFYRHSAYNCAIRPSENIRESVATLYDRRECEKDDDISYFKRIVVKLQGESDDDYVERLTRIRSRFGNLPLWNSCEYLDLTKNYYKLLYAKKDNESVSDYYKRLTTKSTSEDLPSYVKRIDILQRVFNNLPLWNNCDYLQFTAPFYKYVFAKKPSENNESYLKRITTRNPGETLDNYLNRLNVCRWVNRGTDLFYNRAYWPYIKNYYESYFKKGKEEVDNWLAKIFKRDYEESDDEYVKKCSLLTSVTSVLDSLSRINIPEAALKYTSDFYRLHYKRLPNEDKESWLQRVTKKLPIETDITYETRLKYLENVYTDCRSFVGGVLKRLFGSGKSCTKEADKEVEVLLVKKKETLKKEVTAAKNTKKTESNKKPEKNTIEDDIEEIYGKKKDEDEISWFKRLTKKSSGETPEQYIKTLNLVRKFFPSIPLWYNKKNLDLVKEYYTCLYNKLQDETDEQYFNRIVSKEPWESLDQTAERVALVRDIYPTLLLWTDEKFYDKFVKKVYKAEYKKKPTESYEQYVQRLLAKDELVDTSTDFWAKRIHLVQMATASSPVWFDEKYYSFTKDFFEAWYKKDDNEGCTTWLTRILKPLEGESEDNAIKRVGLIKQTTGNCGCWTEFTFKKVASSRCLSEEYLDDIEDKFFDSATTYERIYSSSKSSSRAESSSASEESVEVVKKA